MRPRTGTHRRLRAEDAFSDDVKLKHGSEGCHRRALLLHLLEELGAGVLRHLDTTIFTSPFRVFGRQPAELTLLSRAIGEDFGGARLGVLGLKRKTEIASDTQASIGSVTNIQKGS